MSTSYKRVASTEQTGGDVSVNSSNTRRNSNSNTSNSNVVAEKLWAFAWVMVAVGTAIKTQFYHVILQSNEANRLLLHVAACLAGIQTVLVLYLTVYLPKVKGLITDSSAYAVYCPRVIPCMTVTGIVFGLLLIRAVWPVWGFLAPAVVGIQAMGLLFAFHFVPWPF